MVEVEDAVASAHGPGSGLPSLIEGLLSEILTRIQHSLHITQRPRKLRKFFLREKEKPYWHHWEDLRWQYPQLQSLVRTLQNELGEISSEQADWRDGMRKELLHLLTILNGSIRNC